MQKGLVCRFCKGPHLSARCPHRVFFLSYNNEQSLLEKKEEVKEPSPSASSSSNTIEGRYVPPALRKTTERTTECNIEYYIMI